MSSLNDRFWAIIDANWTPSEVTRLVALWKSTEDMLERLRK